MVKKATVNITVTDQLNRGVSNAEVYIDSKFGFTDMNGKISFNNIPYGMRTIKVVV